MNTTGRYAYLLLLVAICEVGCTEAYYEAEARREYRRTHWSVTFDQPLLDGRDARAKLVDWEIREYNGKCVPLVERFDMGAVEQCKAKLEKLYHDYERRAGLRYRSLSQDVSPKWPRGSLPPPPPPPMMPMMTDCTPDAWGGGFRCTSY